MGILGNVLAGSQSAGLFGGRRGGISPVTLALLGTLAYRTLKGRGRLSELLGNSRNRNGVQENSNATDLESGVRDLIGPGGLAAGLGHLMNRLRQNGQGTKAESWVTTGTNKDISPDELEEGLGAERIAWLMEQTGLSKEELMAGLSQTLPAAVDKLTPEGHIPSDVEAKRLM